MADTDNVASAVQKIKEGVVRFSRPVSEAFGQLMAGNINGLIDDVTDIQSDIVDIENVVNSPGDINWSTQTDSSIPAQKIEVTTVAVNESGASAAAGDLVYTATFDGLIFFRRTSYVNDANTCALAVNDSVDTGVDAVIYGESDGARTASGVFNFPVPINNGQEVRYHSDDGDSFVTGTLYIYRF